MKSILLFLLITLTILTVSVFSVSLPLPPSPSTIVKKNLTENIYKQIETNNNVTIKVIGNNGIVENISIYFQKTSHKIEKSRITEKSVQGQVTHTTQILTSHAGGISITLIIVIVIAIICVSALALAILGSRRRRR